MTEATAPIDRPLDAKGLSKLDCVEDDSGYSSPFKKKRKIVANYLPRPISMRRNPSFMVHSFLTALQKAKGLYGQPL